MSTFNSFPIRQLDENGAIQYKISQKTGTMTQQLIEHAIECGVPFKKPSQIDLEKTFYFDIDGDKDNSKHGLCKVYYNNQVDNVNYGKKQYSFFNVKIDSNTPIGNPLTDDTNILTAYEMEQIRNSNDKELNFKREEVQRDWESWEWIESSPYTDDKHIFVPSHLIKQVPMDWKYKTKDVRNKNCFAVVMYNEDGSFCSVQLIADDGAKSFLAGMPKKSKYSIIGTDNPTYIVEGFATGTSVFNATHKTVIVAFDAGNVPEVAKLFPACKAIPDIDEPEVGKNYGAGLRHIVGENINYIVLSNLPNTTHVEIDEKGNEHKKRDFTDANDLFMWYAKQNGQGFDTSYGLKMLKQDIESAMVQNGMNLYESKTEDMSTPMNATLPMDNKKTITRQVRTLADIKASSGLVRKWLWRKWIPLGATKVWVFGESGCGKSHFILGLMLSIANGVPFLGIETVNEPRDVIYILGEGTDATDSRVIANIEGRSELSEENIQKHYIEFTESFYLNDKKGLECDKLISDIKAMDLHPVLIVFDTMNYFLEGDESKESDVNGLLHYSDKLMKTFTCCVLFVHHIGLAKDAQERLRGSTAMRGAADSNILIQADKKKPKDPLITFNIIHDKLKISKTQPSIKVRIHDIETSFKDEDGRCVFAPFVLRDETPQPIVQNTDKAELRPKVIPFFKFLISLDGYIDQFNKGEVAFTDIQVNDWFDTRHANDKSLLTKDGYKNKKSAFLKYDIATNNGDNSIIHKCFTSQLFTQPTETDVHKAKNGKLVGGWTATTKDNILIQEAIDWWKFKQQNPEQEQEEQSADIFKEESPKSRDKENSKSKRKSKTKQSSRVKAG